MVPDGLPGTAATCVVLVVSSLLAWDAPGTVYLLAGSVIHLAGAFLVTILFNIPRNDALAAGSASAEGAGLWDGDLRGWTAWNHVRSVAALAAAASLTIALYLLHDVSAA